MATNTTTDSLDINVIRGEDGRIDINAIVKEAERLGKEYAEKDRADSETVGKLAEKALSRGKIASEKSFTLATLGRLVANLQDDVLPTDSHMKSVETHLKSWLSGQPSFHHVSRQGRGAGYYRLSLLNDEEKKALGAA